MSENLPKSICEEFQNQLADLVGSGSQVENHPHIKVCALCSQLVHDLKTIAENSRHFRFGADEPDPDEWPEAT